MNERFTLEVLNSSKKAIIFLAVIVFFSFAASSQSSSLKCNNYTIQGYGIVLSDSLTIDPKSISISPHHSFTFDQNSGQITFEESGSKSTLEVCYRVLPIQSSGVFFNKSLSLYDSTAAFKDVTSTTQFSYQKEELFSTPEIYKSGSLTRGVSFGNSQSLNVNSSFNFQMDGKLSDNLNIRADITDQNVPFQPEGNTLQLREFDNVIFEVYNEKLSLKAGDIILKNGASNFMRYYKNAQGGQLDVSYDIDKNIKGSSSVAVASAKGQFGDVSVKAVEGLQGPYQLPGADGQRYVVVLANTESVYLDGRLLTRGYNHDYVIDYNLGEVTFNPTVQITQFTRIRVTFEYSDQNYSRSIINANQTVTIGKTNIHFGFYREKDNRNKPLAFSLSDEDKLEMSLAGDQNLPVAIPGDTPIDFNPNLTLYEKKDTLDQEGDIHEIFVFSRDSTQSLFQVSYSNVGLGNGDYELLQNDVNGRVYAWVSPMLGVKQGDFAAVRFVPAPNSKQLITLGIESKLSDYVSVFSEVAFSDQDLNLYSEIDNENNQDMAYKIGLGVNKVPLEFLANTTLSAAIDFEHDGGNFKPIDRYRSMEYDRDWSYRIESDTSRQADNILNTSFSVNKDYLNLLSIRVSLRQKKEAIDGVQEEVNLKKSFGPLKLIGHQFYLKNENPLEKSDWKRWSAEAYFDQFFVVPGVKVEEDRNEVKLASNDSLYRSAMNYTAQQYYVRNNDSLKVNFRLDYTLREDRAVQDGFLVPYSHSATSSANLSTHLNKSNRVDLTFTYREIDYKESFSSLEDENSILGRLNWQGSLFNRHLRTDLSYATSSSREILREYIYIEVTPGEGTHAWRDLNGDGIQDLTEFFRAINFDEKLYIRVFVPTSDFVNAFNTVFIFSINIQAPRKWRATSGLKGLIGKFSNRTSININKKNTNSDFGSRFNPFDLDIANEELIYMRDALRTIFFYNKSGRGLGGDFGYQVNHSKQLISRGIESRASQEYALNLRFHISKQFSVICGLKNGEKENASQYQEDRSYLIKSYSIEPGVVWQPKNNVRFGASYRITQKQNDLTPESNESSKVNGFNIESRWSNGAKNSLNATFKITNIEFVGDQNTAVAYELLEALQPGSNLSWQLNYNQKLISGLQMNLGYEGRKSSDRPVIHMGRMQVTALF